MSAYFDALRVMTEKTYLTNNQSKVIYICHSMGCPILLYFFNHQTEAWKDQYVRALISLGGAWAGAVKALKAFASGENLGVYVINNLVVRKEQQTCPSLAYMLPFDTFWNRSEILVQTEKKNYSLANLYDFFQDISFPAGYEMWKDTYNLTRLLVPPNVEVHCLHGVAEDTIDRLIYRPNKFPDSVPDVVYGDGDGTVNLRSLEGCLRFKGNQKQKVYHVPFKNVDHMGILADQNVLDYITKVVTSH